MKINVYLILFAFLFSCYSSEVDTNQQIDDLKILNDATILYKSNSTDNNLTSLDIYTVSNSTSLKPIVIWVHGGGWVTGDKANDMPNKSSFFTNLGYVFVAVNYRLSPFPYELNNNSRIKHPAHVIDVADALEWISNNIEKYGGDATKMVLLGHSAGAHLVALAGTNQQLFEDRNLDFSVLKGIISLDTQAYNVPYAINNLTQKDLYINAFSDNVAIQKDASPYHHLDNFNNINPNWLFVSRGTTTRKQILKAFEDKVKLKNGITEVVAMDAYSHEDVNDLIADTANTILSNTISQFLATVFN